MPILASQVPAGGGRFSQHRSKGTGSMPMLAKKKQKKKHGGKGGKKRNRHLTLPCGKKAGRGKGESAPAQMKLLILQKWEREGKIAQRKRERGRSSPLHE